MMSRPNQVYEARAHGLHTVWRFDDGRRLESKARQLEEGGDTAGPRRGVYHCQLKSQTKEGTAPGLGGHWRVGVAAQLGMS